MPPGRVVVPHLTAEENILLGMTFRANASVLRRFYEFFPILGKKEIARTLMRPKAMKNVSMIVSEQAESLALDVADSFLIIERGEFVHKALRSEIHPLRIQALLTN